MKREDAVVVGAGLFLSGMVVFAGIDAATSWDDVKVEDPYYKLEDSPQVSFKCAKDVVRTFDRHPRATGYYICKDENSPGSKWVTFLPPEKGVQNDDRVVR